MRKPDHRDLRRVERSVASTARRRAGGIPGVGQADDAGVYSSGHYNHRASCSDESGGARVRSTAGSASTRLRRPPSANSAPKLGLPASGRPTQPRCAPSALDGGQNGRMAGQRNLLSEEPSQPSERLVGSSATCSLTDPRVRHYGECDRQRSPVPDVGLSSCYVREAAPGACLGPRLSLTTISVRSRL